MSIPIPPERVPPIAKEVADARKTYAILWWFGSALAALIAYGQSSKRDDGTSEIAGIAFWAVVLVWLGVRQWRIARRATEAARLAQMTGTSFVLAGNQLIAIDERQVSQPSASFKLSGKLVTMLTALPTAQLRQ
jgi:hypothetical protein